MYLRQTYLNLDMQENTTRQLNIFIFFIFGILNNSFRLRFRAQHVEFCHS